MKRLVYHTAILVLTLTAATTGCRKEPPLQSPDMSETEVAASDLTFSVVKNNAAADGAQYNEYLVKADNSLKSNFTEATFEIAPDARFSNGAARQTVPLDVNGEARVYARSTQVGSATVRATVGTYSRQLTTEFTTAWPDLIVVEADSALLPPLPGAKTAIRAKLLRTSGAVSPGITVQFSDSTGLAATPSVGSFLNTTPSSTAGIATTEYWLQDTSFHHDVYIIATTKTQSGNGPTGRTRIRIRQ